MGFLARQYRVLIPNLLLHISFLVSCAKIAACWMMQELCLADDASFDHNQNAPFAYMEAIREWLPVSTFGYYLQRFGDLEEQEAECAVCLSRFQEEDEIRELRNCCHIFHKACLDKWLDHSHITCPLCRCCLMTDVDLEASQTGEQGKYSWIVDMISFVFANEMLYEYE